MPLDGLHRKAQRLLSYCFQADSPRASSNNIATLLRSSGMAYRELAATLSIEPGSVGTLLARAEAEFERRFRARYGENV